MAGQNMQQIEFSIRDEINRGRARLIFDSEHMYDCATALGPDASASCRTEIALLSNPNNIAESGSPRPSHPGGQRAHVGEHRFDKPRLGVSVRVQVQREA